MKLLKVRIDIWKKRFGNISLFWRYLLMMLCILLLCLVALVAVYQRSLNTLTDENLEKLRITFMRDCESLDVELYSGYSIPYAMEDSKYFQYIQFSDTGRLEKDGYFVMSLLEETLTNQIYLQSESDRVLIYNLGTNSIVSTTTMSPAAEDYFNKKLVFSQTDLDTVMFYLKRPNTIKLLPAQPVYIAGQESNEAGTDRLTLIIRPKNSRVSLMSLYSVETLTNKLSIPNLPEGTYLEMRDKSGELLLQYPDPVPENAERDSYLLECSLRRIGADVSIHVPKDYFADLLGPMKSLGIGVIILVAVLGIVMVLLFSRASVAPIRRLIHRHENQEDEQGRNELNQLDALLSGAQRKNTQMYNRLTKQMLARALSGSVLSENDEAQLAEGLPQLAGEYRVAILHTSEAVNNVLSDYLKSAMPDAAWTMLNARETGLVFRASDEELERVMNLAEEMQTRSFSVFCGISAVTPTSESLHTAAQQARVAIPQDAGVNVFSGEQVENQGISWLQHERLYQFIFSNQEEKALQLLSSIAAETNSSNAREVFYNIRFVLRSVAEEMDVALPWTKSPEYVPSRLPQENIQSLQIAIHNLFVNIAEKNGKRSDSRLAAILEYIQANMDDCELCVASAAKHFGISERLLYDIMQKQAEMSFSEYLTALRMEKAAKLLQTTHINVAEVGQRCGYRISSTFYRLFKDYYGMSPGQFRSSGKKDQKED